MGPRAATSWGNADILAVASKKKGNKKKKNAKGKSNGDAHAGPDAVDSPIDDRDGEGDGDEPDSALVRMPPVRLPEGKQEQTDPICRLQQRTHNYQRPNS